MDCVDCCVYSGGRFNLLNFMWRSWPVGDYCSW